MPKILLVDKSGEIKSTKFNVDKDELYKKCKFKKPEEFEMKTSWKTKKVKNISEELKYVYLYAREVGKANTENKYDFPPPVDKDLYFGCCALVGYSDEGEDPSKMVDLLEEDWDTIYEHLFGGFENLNSTAKEDEEEEDELDTVPDEMKTKSGYLKDDFVVEDADIEDEEGGSSDEDEWEDTSELNFEDYDYESSED